MQIRGIQPGIFKSFFQSIEQLFLTVGQNNFGNKIPFNSFFFLSVGQHYAIRVRALNAAGAGPWSLESDQLNCKYSRLRPKVSFKDVATKEVVTFKAGESMAFEVDIQGEPPAHDIIWSLAGKELTDGGVGIKIDNSKPYKSFISVDGLTRKDIGALDCTATNMEGIKSFYY